ncbi:hypothetical protein HanPSC8_Chr12g0533121 [Helianthus annuus]|nr:hypothetical protein HanPSC8_Chr12g0533121 [Helianthus annuus]
MGNRFPFVISPRITFEVSVRLSVVQGRDRVSVRCVAEQLGLEGSYVPRTYVELMQLEKLVNEVTVLHELKTKLSIDDEMLSSPKETFSLAATRNNFLKRYIFFCTRLESRVLLHG